MILRFLGSAVTPVTVACAGRHSFRREAALILAGKRYLVGKGFAVLAGAQEKECSRLILIKLA